jgi:AcrR family transcriptional regulator
MDTKQSSAGGKPYHHGNLRQALIEAALDILERGSAPLTIRATAKAAGVSHTAPYNHFADKEALLAAVAIRGFETLEAAVEAARAQAGPDPGAQLAASGEAYVFFAADHPALFRLMFGPRQADDTVRTAGLSAFDALVRVVQDGMEAGAFRPGDARATAFTAWSLVHGMAQLAIDRTGPLKPEDRVEITDRLRAAHTVMMDGLRPR